jgi:predicted acyl esterase
MTGDVAIRRAARSVRTVIPALLLLASACVKHSVIPDEPDVVTIFVSNNNPLDMTVYAVNSGMRVRLGTVVTASSQRFTISLHQVSPTGELQLLADPIGSRRTMTSEAIHVFAGQAIEWILQVDLRQSSLTIRS